MKVPLLNLCSTNLALMNGRWNELQPLAYATIFLSQGSITCGAFLIFKFHRGVWIIDDIVSTPSSPLPHGRTLIL